MILSQNLPLRFFNSISSDLKRRNKRMKKFSRMYTPSSLELGHQHQIFHVEPTILSNNKQKSIFTVKGERQAELALQTLN